MKKRLLLILVMATTIICAMAIVASATTDKDNSYWDGWVFYFTGTAEEAADLTLYAVIGEEQTVEQKVDISVGANDFTAIASKNVFDVNGTYYSELYVTDDEKFYCGRHAYAIKTTVTVEEASSEDVNFTYAIDSVVVNEDKDKDSQEGIWLSLDDPANYPEIEDYSLFVDTITLKAGEKTATGVLYFGEKKAGMPKAPKEDKEVLGYVIKEAGNTGKYQTAQSVWVWTPRTITEEAKQLAAFEDKAALQAFLDKVNNSEMEDAEEMLVAAFKYNEMAFAHAKGVQTGDSNNMVLFVILFVMAVVAAGAVALKRN